MLFGKQAIGLSIHSFHGKCCAKKTGLSKNWIWSGETTKFQSLLICKLKRDSEDSNSVTDYDYKSAFGISYDFSPKLTVGILKENSKISDDDDQLSIAAQYEINENNKVKAKLDRNGIFGFFHRGKFGKNFTSETSFKSGLNPDQKINGILGSNFQIGVKLLFNN